MSYQTESWAMRNLIYITIIIVLIPGISMMAIISHDGSIDREELFFKIYKNDSCEELFQALSYEDRKIIRDQTETKVLTNFIMENNC